MNEPTTMKKSQQQISRVYAGWEKLFDVQMLESECGTSRRNEVSERDKSSEWVTERVRLNENI